MAATPGRVRPYRISPGEPLTVDVLGADGTRLRVRDRLDSAPDQHTGDIATRIVVTDARAEVLD
jgi:hypothetical protein